MPRAYWLIFLLALLALPASTVRLGRGKGTVLPSYETGAKPMGEGAFQPNAVHNPAAITDVPRGVDTRGSWLGTDAFRGQYETGWYRAKPFFKVMLTGYPAQKGVEISACFRLKDGSTQTVRYHGPDIGESWQPWNLYAPANAIAFQLRAIDDTAETFGWAGFSEPFFVPDQASRQVWPVVQMTLAGCLALVLIYGPGLLWLRRQPRPVGHVALAILIGPLLLAALGLLCWALGGWIAPSVVARLGIACGLAALAGYALSSRNPAPLPMHAGRVIAVAALLVGFAGAKTNFSIGPKGELFHWIVSRTLEVGGHSDSRISYHVVQVIAHHLTPFEPEARKYFEPWSFASRGPMAGVIAAPLVLATAVRVPLVHPDENWQPFDREGFAVYRLVLIVLGSLVAWAVFGVTASVSTPAWGLVAAVIVHLAPFFPHEMFFTWPKLPAAALVLTAFYCIQQGKSFLGGIVLGLAYLFHPMVLLSAPFLGLWAIARHVVGTWDFPAVRRAVGAGAWLTIGTLLFVVPWQWLGRLGPGGGQSAFFTYFHLADNHLASWSVWWLTRWENFANTFLPLYLFTFDPAHESLNSVYERSDPWVQASFLYWNTLPFALGLPAFALVMGGIFSALRRQPGVLFLTFIAPSVLLMIYWGAACTGLMRHCGHVLFVSTVVLGTWALGQAGPWKTRALAAFFHPVCFIWRGFEVALFAFGTSLLHRRPDWVGPLGWNDGLSLAIAATCLIAAVILLARGAKEIAAEISRPNAG